MHEPASHHLSLPEQASFLAARTIAYATAYLDGRDDSARLALHAEAMQTELMTAWPAGAAEIRINAILDPVRLLVVSMRRVSVAQGIARQDRWQQVMSALVDLVRHEAGELRAPELPPRGEDDQFGGPRLRAPITIAGSAS